MDFRGLNFVLVLISGWESVTGESKVATLQGYASGRCIDVPGVSQENNAPIDIWDCVYGANNQIWELRVISGEYIQILPTHSGKCMTVFGAFTDNNVNINQYDCVSGSDNQLWELLPASSRNGQFQIRGKQSNRCVTVAYGGTTSGVLLNIYDCMEAGNQLWYVVETSRIPWDPSSGSLANTGGVIVGTQSERCVSIDGASADDNAIAVLWDCYTGAKNQVWTVKPFSGNDVQLIVAQSGKCLTVASAFTDNDTPINQYSCIDGGRTNQLWQIIQIKGKTQLRGKGSGRCMTANGGWTTNGVILNIYDCIAADNQLWTIQGNPNAPIINLPDQAVTYQLQVSSSKCVDVTGASQEDSVDAIPSDCSSGATSQQWKARYIADEYFQLYNVNSGKCLTVYGGTDNNAQINQYTCTDGAGNQLWKLLGQLTAPGQIQGKASSRCLTSSYGDTIMNMYDCIGAGNQLWTLHNIFQPAHDVGSNPVYKLDITKLHLNESGMSIGDTLTELKKYVGKSDISDLTDKFAKQTAWHDTMTFWMELAQLHVTSPLKFLPGIGPAVADALEVVFTAVTLGMPDKPDFFSELADSIVGRRIDENNYKLFVAKMQGIRDLYITFTTYLNSPPYSADTQDQIYNKFDTLVGTIEAALPTFLLKNSEDKAGGIPLYALAATVSIQAYITVLRSPDLPMSTQKWNKNYELLYKFIHRCHREMSSITSELIKDKSEADQIKVINAISMNGLGLFNAMARKFFGLKNGRKDIRTRISNEFYPYHAAEYKGTVKDVVAKDILKRVSPMQRLKTWSAKIGTARIEYDTLDAFGNKNPFAFQSCDGQTSTTPMEYVWKADQTNKDFGSDANWAIASVGFKYYEKHYDPNSLMFMKMKQYDEVTTQLGDGGSVKEPDTWFGTSGYFMNSIMMTGGNRHSDCFDFDFINVPTVTFRHISSYEYIPFFDTLDSGIELDSTSGYYNTGSGISAVGTNEPFLGKTTITSTKIVFGVVGMTENKVFSVNVNAVLSPGDSTPIKVWASQQNSTLSKMFGDDSQTMSGIYSSGKFSFYEGSIMLNLYKGMDNEVTIYTEGAAFELASLTLTP